MSKYLIRNSSFHEELDDFASGLDEEYQTPDEFVQWFNSIAHLLTKRELKNGKHPSHSKPITSLVPRDLFRHFNKIECIDSASGFNDLCLTINKHLAKQNSSIEILGFPKINESPISNAQKFLSKETLNELYMYYLDDYTTFDFSKPSVEHHTQLAPTSTELQCIKYFRDANERLVTYKRALNREMSDLVETKKKRNQELDHLLELKEKRNQELDHLLELNKKRNQELDHLLKLKKKRNQELEAILIDNDKVIESLAIKNQYLKSIQLEHTFLKEDNDKVKESLAIKNQHLESIQLEHTFLKEEIKKLRLQIKSAKAVTFGFKNLQHLSIQQIQAEAENSIKKCRYKEALQYLNYAYALTNSYKILLKILPLKCQNKILRFLLLRFSSLFGGY
ncbi:hypothetical protein FZX13_12170 [Synechococcus sp. MU1625]|nr:hypothetical protein [Synechococcus sp. MU1625]